MAKIINLVLLLALLFSAVSAKNSAPAPAVDCASLVLNMADCLSYVSADGTASKPEGTCCDGLKMVLKSNAECLCEAFRNSAQLGVTLNNTKAMALPSACHVSAPSVSNCGLSVSTGGAPGASPMMAPTSSVAGAPTAVISANDISPAPGPVNGVAGASGSSAVSVSVEMFGLATLAAVASLALF